jgi:ubiquinone/menaquinone biosynthesis C-methylase UbiE
VSSPSIDILTSPTLKHLRERWWNDEFTAFLVERLKPRPGNRILDVGCGEGLGEVSIGRRHLSQVRMVGIDLIVEKVIEARRATEAHNQRVGFAAASAVSLPFRDGAFDSTYCVAVLQHVPDAMVESCVAEFARVTRSQGRVVAVEPDNTSRSAYSSVPSGAAVFETAERVFAAVSADHARSRVGPRLAHLFSRNRIEPVEVRLFPVSLVFLGVPADDVWQERRRVVEALARVEGAALGTLAADYLELLGQYEADARTAGAGFVEIQNTTLFATVGQRT